MSETKSIVERLEAKCHVCDGARGGTGEESGMWYRCHTCDGTGFVPIDRRAISAELREIAERLKVVHRDVSLNSSDYSPKSTYEIARGSSALWELIEELEGTQKGDV